MQSHRWSEPICGIFLSPALPDDSEWLERSNGVFITFGALGIKMERFCTVLCTFCILRDRNIQWINIGPGIVAIEPWWLSRRRDDPCSLFNAGTQSLLNMETRCNRPTQFNDDTAPSRDYSMIQSHYDAWGVPSTCCTAHRWTNRDHHPTYHFGRR